MPVRDDLTVARQHELVQCERVGDTLVVTPIGDRMEFSNGTFEHELARIRRIASNEAVRNIVCDFSKKDYFSQELVVPLFSLRDHIRTRGRFVTAGMSEQMSKMFEHSESGTHFMQFPSRQAAISEVADLTFSQAISARFLQNRRVLLPVLCVVVASVAVAGWTVIGDRLVNGTPAAQLYDTLASAWDDANDVVQSSPTKANWNGLKNRLLEGLVDPVADLREKPNKSPAEIAVLSAANQLQAIAIDPRGRIEMLQSEFVKLAEEARLAIESEDGYTLDPIPKIEFPPIN